MRTIRASSLPALMACPGSGVAPAVALPRDETAADVGTDAHAELAHIVGGERIDLDDIESVDVRVLVAQGIKLWNQVRQSFPMPSTEQAFVRKLPGCDVELTGHVDIISAHADSAGKLVVSVADWKTGRLDSEYIEQLRAYAWLASEGADVLRGSVLWVREGDVEAHTWTPRYLDAWAEDVVARVVNWDGTLYPGPHCAHCRRAHECDARTALVRANVAALTDVLPSAIETMAPEQIVELHARVKLVSQACDNIHNAIRERVLSGGDIVSQDGRLTTEASERRSIDAAKAWPVLETMLDVSDPARFFEAVSVSWADVSKLAMKLAPKGDKKGAATALENALVEAGALTTTTSHKLVTRRA